MNLQPIMPYVIIQLVIALFSHCFIKTNILGKSTTVCGDELKNSFDPPEPHQPGFAPLLD
jgi:hypothetical protein